MTAVVALLFLLSGLFWLAPLVSDPMGILFWRGGAYSDLLISHWPNAGFVRQSLIQWNQVPLWNPMILSGAPFVADPLSGLFYPPNWLAVVINPGAAFGVLAWLHIAWGGFGAWRIARDLGISSASALVVGLAFAGMPKLIGHIGLGHMSLVFAVCWTPWILLAFSKAIRQLNARSATLAGTALGLVFLIDPRWYLPLALLSAAFSLWRVLNGNDKSGITNRSETETGSESKPGSESVGRGRTEDLEDRPTNEFRDEIGISTPANGKSLRNIGRTPRSARQAWLRISVTLIGAGVMSVAVGSILAAPLGEFASLSTRSSLTLDEAVELSLPPQYLRNILAPEYAGWPEWQIYAGVVVLFLALVAVSSRISGRWFWAGVVIASLLIAFGTATPFFALTSAVVPGFHQLRVPPRSLFLSSFALIMLAGMGLDRIRARKVDGKQLRTLGAAIAGGALVIGTLTWFRDQASVQAAAYLVSAALIGLSVIWAGISRRRPWQWSIAGWCLLIIFDLGLVNLSTLEVRPGPDIQSNWDPIVANTPRMFSPSYSLPQPAAAANGIELADGINPLQLAAYEAYMSRASGFRSGGYSVALPPFLDGDPQLEWGFKPDNRLLGMLSVSTIVSRYPVQDTDLIFEGMENDLYLYSNPLAKPRAWIDRGNPVSIVDWTPNRILLEATGPGKLIVSEMAYPGWQVEVDGAPDKIEVYEGIFRAVQLEAGNHEVALTFRSDSLRAGALVTLLALIVAASLWIRR